MSEQPAPGWYAAPNREGFIQWWDGAAWTDNVQATPPTAPTSEAIAAPAPTAKPSKTETAVKATMAAGMAAAGAALAADGAIGLGSKRKGLKGIAGYFIWGAVLFIIGFIGLLGGMFGASAPSSGSPILGSVLVGLIAVLLFTIGSVKLIVRAGSIAGGLLLIREGAKRGSNLQK